jgi:hypothetical protein
MHCFVMQVDNGSIYSPQSETTIEQANARRDEMIANGWPSESLGIWCQMGRNEAQRVA